MDLLNTFGDTRYFDQNMFNELRRYRLTTKQPDVLHQRTCPDCGRTLVNLYFFNPNGTDSRPDWLTGWRCKRCWDRATPNK